MSAPKVTVLMPVYNAGKYVAEAIESVLSQSYPAFDFLIIDDGSTDDSLDRIRSYRDPRIRVVSHSANRGLIATLNEGVGLARTELIARMDADDICYPDRLEKQVAAFQGNPRLVLVGSDLHKIDQSGCVTGYAVKPTDSDALKIILSVICPIAHPSVIFKRDAVTRSGGYQDFPVAEDYDLWTRLAQEGEFCNLPMPLMQYRINLEGESLQRTGTQELNSRIISKREWSKYGQRGPAPLGSWQRIWPARWGLKAARPNELKFYADLHRRFADGYAERGQFGMALGHRLAALYWRPHLIADSVQVFKIVGDYFKGSSKA